MPPKRPHEEGLRELFAVKWTIAVEIDEFDSEFDASHTETQSDAAEDEAREQFELHDNGQLEHVFASKASALKAAAEAFHELCRDHWQSHWDPEGDMGDGEEWNRKITKQCFDPKNCDFECVGDWTEEDDSPNFSGHHHMSGRIWAGIKRMNVVP